MRSPTETNQASIGARLKAVRETLGDTQQEMAARIGSSFSAYRAYESGERPMRSDHLTRLGEQGFDLNWLMLNIGVMHRVPRLPTGLAESAAAPFGHSDSFPGSCSVRSNDGAVVSRSDLVPEVLAPVLEWISKGIAAAGGAVDWKWAAGQVIGRYDWDFNTWLRTRNHRPGDDLSSQ